MATFGDPLFDTTLFDEGPSSPAPPSDYYFYDSFPYNPVARLAAWAALDPGNNFLVEFGVPFHPPAPDGLAYFVDSWNQPEVRDRIRKRWATDEANRSAILPWAANLISSEVPIWAVVTPLPIAGHRRGHEFPRDWIAFLDVEPLGLIPPPPPPHGHHGGGGGGNGGGNGHQQQLLMARYWAATTSGMGTQIFEPPHLPTLPIPPHQFGWEYRDSFTYRQAQWNRLRAFFKSAEIGAPVDWEIPATVPSFDWAFSDSDNYSSRSRIRHADFQSLYAAPDPAVIIIPAVPGIDAWMPMIFEFLVRHRSQEGKAFLGLPNDIPEGAIFPGWEFISYSDPGPLSQKRRQWERLAAWYKQEPLQWPIGLLIRFNAQMATFNAHLSKSYLKALHASMAQFEAFLGVQTPRPPALINFFLKICDEIRSIMIQKELDPEIGEEVRGITAMPTARIQCITFAKDPQATKDYFVDWSQLLDSGETISTSTWAGGGLTVGTTWITGDKAYAFLSGGTSGTSYTVSNTIVTSKSRTYVRQILIAVRLT